MKKCKYGVYAIGSHDCEEGIFFVSLKTAIEFAWKLSIFTYNSYVYELKEDNSVPCGLSRKDDPLIQCQEGHILEEVIWKL